MSSVPVGFSYQFLCLISHLPASFEHLPRSSVIPIITTGNFIDSFFKKLCYSLFFLLQKPDLITADNLENRHEKIKKKNTYNSFTWVNITGDIFVYSFLVFSTHT